MTSGVSRVYVTGAAGMIGSTVCRYLLDAGHEVVGIDNLWRGTVRNLADLKANSGFQFRHADIVADQEWYLDMDADAILVHTADIVAGIGYVFANEWRVFQKNILINTQIARVVAQFQPRQLVYLGTACSYPQGLQRSVSNSVLSEDVKFPADPESGYGWSKLIGQIEFGLATKGTRTRLTTLDLHNVYGWPCIYDDATSQVIPSLIYKAIRSTDRQLVVWGDGKQGRAFLHVRDVAQGVLKVIGYAGAHSTFMLGPDRCTSIGEVARMIVAHRNIGIDEIVYDTSKPTGDIGRYADATRALTELGWSESVRFEDGLSELIDAVLTDHQRNTA